jgi:hypothetical protein
MKTISLTLIFLRTSSKEPVAHFSYSNLVSVNLSKLKVSSTQC